MEPSDPDPDEGARPSPPPPRVESTDRWVRAEWAGHTVADSRRAMLHVAFGPPLVPESRAPMLPSYFFPMDDVATTLLVPSDDRAGRRFWHLELDGRRVADAAWAYVDPAGPLSALAGHVTFRWEAVDAWFEEAEEVSVHARDTRKRVDLLSSNRHVEVALGGRTLARSSRPTLLFETDLPTRYYLPPADVDMDQLTPSPTTSGCPYKGMATYWSVEDAGEQGRDLAWTYPDPIPEQPRLAGLVCFFNERVDLTVDGELVPRPWTPWS